MNKLKPFLTLAVVFATALPLMAQPKRVASTGGVSPHETISQTFDGARDNRVTIVYGRPYTKNPRTGEMRKIWGGLVPYGKIWRTGADEATIMALQKPIVLGDTTIPAGAYTLFTLPEADGAKLIINKQVGQWGIGRGAYDEKQDVARVDMKRESLDPAVDQFTIVLDKNPDGGGILKMQWENTQYSVPFKVEK